MPESKSLNTRCPDRFRWLALLAATAGFLLLVARFHIPGKGFTALINFGEVHASRYLSEIDPRTTYVTPDSDGDWRAPLPPEVHDWLLVLRAA